METPTTLNSSVILETRITAVTVYTDQALITRRGMVTLTGQERTLVLSNLPLTLQPESIRAGGTGTVAVRLLGVQTEHVFATEPIADRVAQIHEQLKQLEIEQQSLHDRVTALELQRTFIHGLSEKAVDRFSRSLAQQHISLAETRNLLNFVGQRHNDLSDAIAQHNRELLQLNQQKNVLSQQLQQIQTPHHKESYCLTVSILPAGAGDFELEISYVCHSASWQPRYDLHVKSADHRLHLTYLADLQQTTGEDWHNVALTLSTAKPGLGTLPPKLVPWYIDVFQPAPPPMAMMRSASEDGDFSDFALSSIAPKMFEAQAIAAQITNEGGVVTFQIDGNSNIPGDGAHKLTIFSAAYPCRLQYIAMPKLVSFAYLQAVVTNPSNGATLLAGQANLFRDNRFVGTTSLENIAPGQEWKLNLGIDEGLHLTRDLIERKVDKQLIGGQRRLAYTYRLVVINLREQDANLTLTEQLPVSRNEQIKVRLNRTSPQIQPGEMGLLEWSLLLQPNDQQELSYQFTVEHSPTLTVTGLSG